MNKLIILSIVILMIPFSVYADCAQDNGCYNQNGKPFCSKTDSSCTYRFYNSGCAYSSDSDSDSDSWSDGCDAFPNDNANWIDLDGDGYGNANDCNDLNSNINPAATETCGNSIDDNCDGIDCSVQGTSTSSSGGSGGGSGGGSFIQNTCESKWDCSEWSECSDGVETRTCTDSKNCNVQIDKPAVKQLCFEESSQVMNASPAAVFTQEIIPPQTNFEATTTSWVKGSSLVYIISILLIGIFIGALLYILSKKEGFLLLKKKSARKY